MVSIFCRVSLSIPASSLRKSSSPRQILSATGTFLFFSNHSSCSGWRFFFLSSLYRNYKSFFTTEQQHRLIFLLFFVVLGLSVRWNLLELFSDLILEMNDKKILQNDFFHFVLLYESILRKKKKQKISRAVPRSYPILTCVIIPVNEKVQQPVPVTDGIPELLNDAKPHKKSFPQSSRPFLGALYLQSSFNALSTRMINSSALRNSTSFSASFQTNRPCQVAFCRY